MNTPILSWNPEATPEFLVPLLECLHDEYPLRRLPGCGKELVFSSIDLPRALRVTDSGVRITIEYGSPAAAARRIGSALVGQYGNSATSFEKMGIMLDCSRNAVMTVAHVKRWLGRLALMGYNVFMLRTENTSCWVMGRGACPALP